MNYSTPYSKNSKWLKSKSSKVQFPYIKKLINVINENGNKTNHFKFIDNDVIYTLHYIKINDMIKITYYAKVLNESNEFRLILKITNNLIVMEKYRIILNELKKCTPTLCEINRHFEIFIKNYSKEKHVKIYNEKIEKLNNEMRLINIEIDRIENNPFMDNFK